MYHVSNPKFRESILSNGLIPSKGEQRCLGNEFLPPTIFLTSEKPFDSGYDDDVYFVDIDCSSLEEDKVIPDSYYTLKPIGVDKVKLIYKGNGENKD